MLTKYGLPILALALFCFAVFQVVKGQQEPPPAAAPIEPARSPFTSTVAGAGIIEAQTENIAIGSPVPGVVVQVQVKVNQPVKVNDPLFRLDDRSLQAELKVRKASLVAAKAKLEKLQNAPRPEEKPLKQAKIREAEANLADVEDQLKRAKSLPKTAIGAEELSRKEQAVQSAKALVEWAKADYELLKAGTWKPDLLMAQADVEQAEAMVKQTEIELDRLTIRALVDGEVLQVNVRPGEFVGSVPGQAFIVLGNLRKLHVRVDIDEQDIPRFVPGASARAVLRGTPKKEFPLTFVRVEPYVVPKKSLTGDNKERVDTRVLQVIYALDTNTQNVYVGQQVDAFIDLSKRPTLSATTSEADVAKKP
jgi:multidrug resistance efflux pump